MFSSSAEFIQPVYCFLAKPFDNLFPAVCQTHKQNNQPAGSLSAEKSIPFHNSRSSASFCSRNRSAYPCRAAADHDYVIFSCCCYHLTLTTAFLTYLGSLTQIPGMCASCGVNITKSPVFAVTNAPLPMPKIISFSSL